MAFMDYGAIAFKNGKVISTDMFTSMMDMVGWEDNENDTYHNYYKDTDEPLALKDNYFVYIGDSDCTLAFYKCQMAVVNKWRDGSFSYHLEYFNSQKYAWSKWEDWVCYDGEIATIKVTKKMVILYVSGNTKVISTKFISDMVSILIVIENIIS